ncbi:putative ribonuclease H-like domain-containing protein [Tanacetum coccineum]
MHHPFRHQEIAEEPTHEDPPINHDVLHPSHNLVTGDPGSAQSSSWNVNSMEPNQVNYPPDHLRRWTKDHPLDNIVGNPSKSFAPVARIKAIRIFIANAATKNTIIYQTRPIYVMVIALKWIYKVKLDEYVARIEAIRIFIANAATKNMIIYQMDVKTAFLNGDLQEEVFVSQPEGFEDQENPTHVYRLKKALYGLKQAPRRSAIALCRTQRPLNTSTYGTISSESRWKIEWLNSTSWKRIISLQTFSPKHYQENASCEWRVGQQRLLRLVDSGELSNGGANSGLNNSGRIAITPVIPAQPFELPPSGNTVIDFVNELGYPEPVEIVSNIRVNYVYQPWRAILTLINQADMGRVYSRDPDIFLTQGKSQSQSEEPKEEVTPFLIPYGSFPDDEAQQESIPQEEDDDPDLELAKKMSLEAHQEKGEGEGDDADMERAIKLSLDPAFLPQGRAPVGGVTNRDPVSETNSNAMTRDQTPHDSTTGPSSQPEDDTSEKVIHESSSTSDSERTKSETEAAAPKGDKDQDEVDTSTVTSGVSIPVSDPEKAHEALAGPDPEPMKEDQTGSDSGKYVSSTKPSSLVTTPPINTEATTITTSLPEITPFIALQLRVARLEQEMSKVKKTDHQADVLASIKSQVPMASVKNQESKKSPKEIIRAKKEQGEEKQDSTYSIRSTDKVDLEEFDLESALFKHMNKIKSANRNTTNYHLYHTLMEALIADEDAMDKEVADKVKDHKRKHDSDDDEDDVCDEGLLLDQTGRSTKREDWILPLRGQLNLLRKMMTKVQRNKGVCCLASYKSALTQLDGKSLDTRDADEQERRSSAKADLEGQLFNLVKSLLRQVFLQYQLMNAIVFFLRTKDETSGILKDFIRQIENQLNQKVKTIRCDNGTEFKNMDFIEFCGSKGIKREYSNARTPQQNGVAERKNRTLIEAARTMLADSFLPNTFWAEAVSTACYVLNRVLVTKPHNKTPYELVTGKIPIISYIRPFGCHVTILNTIDHLGKFDGKSDEGFLVGYSLQSKAFRVYNLETKRVEENLHITFLENKPNVAGKGPTWLFDLDYLTDSMNYQPVRSENQANKHAGPQEANHNAGTKDNIDAGDSKKEDESAQDYFVLPIWSSYSSTVKRSTEKDAGEASTKHPNLKTDENPADKEDQVFLDELKRLKRQEKDANDAAEALRKEFAQETENLLLQAGAAKASSTNIINTVSTPVSTASPYDGLSFSDPTNPDQDDSEIHALEEIYKNPTNGIFTNSSYDDEGAVADFPNLETVVNVSPIPTSRINSIHPSTLFLGDPQSAVQTRSKVTKSSGAHAFFKIQKVWILVDLPYGKKAIGTKWVYRNKKDERGVVVRNKARLVAQGHRQEEGIDYDKVFAPVARIEAIRIFLAFASYMGFIVYQIDVKSAFLYGKIDEEVYVSQPPSFIDPKYPQKVYKVVKALYGLHQAPRAWYATLSTFLLKNGYRRGTIDKTLFIKKDKHDIILVQVYVDEYYFSQDKYIAEILKKFDFASVKTASKPIETHKPLVKDEEASDVDVHLYRSMIGSLMYLMASRPDIMFAVCACSKFQVTPKTSHLNAVKRIFSDYAGANLDGKSTTEGCQFLGRRLISWQCKKQTVVATSTTEAEYVAGWANCCGYTTPNQRIVQLGTTSLGNAYEINLSRCSKYTLMPISCDFLTKALMLAGSILGWYTIGMVNTTSYIS